jgi:hypothetical protein
MTDPTEAARWERFVQINAGPGRREALERQYVRVWDTQQLAEEFEVKAFLAPLVVVRRRADGVVGSLEFQHRPRLFFFQPHREGDA